MNRSLRMATLWLWGGFVYYMIELAWRGNSHPSMFVVGGLCFLLLGSINNCLSWNMWLVWQAIIGAVGITIIEFSAGLIVNLWLKLNVWDYSNLPMNILGQICLPYTLLWIPLAIIGILLDDYLRWKLYGEECPQYKIL